MSISFFGAFVGGLLTLLSPCSVMLLPAFFAYAFTGAAQIINRTGVFFLGLATTLVPLGMLAGTLGQWIQRYRSEVVLVAALIVIVLGIVMLLGIPIPGLARAQGLSSASIASVYTLGTIYGVAGVCAGPLLGAVLTVAGASASPLFGGLLMLSFAAGMALPLLLLALFWQRVPQVQKLVRPRPVQIGKLQTTLTGIIGGSLTIIIGAVLLITDGTASLGGIINASDLFQIESQALSWSNAVPDWAFALVAVTILAAVWFFVGRKKPESKTAP